MLRGMRRLLPLAAAALAAACVGVPARPAVAPLAGAAGDVHALAAELLSAYLRIDTTNPPGRELPTARFLAAALAREGIASEIFDLGHGRANLRAVLRGRGTKRPLVLLHHMDVVPADPEHWRVPPFSGRVVDGEVYGRGAVDIKGKGIIDLATLIRFKRRGRPLARDLILLAVADEEALSIGARWVAERRPDLVRNAEFLIDEGAMLHRGASGKVEAYFVSTGEKAPLWVRITFTGRAGHGSAPPADSAVNRAIRAAARIIAYHPPLVLLPALRDWLAVSLRGRDLTGLPGFTGDLDTALGRPEFLAAVARDPDLGAALQDTIALTGLQGSDKINTIPNEAVLRLDCRLLPGSDKERFLAQLRRLIDDPSARLCIEQYTPATSSPADSTFVAALRAVAARRHPGVPVVPTILLSSTDAWLFRRLGVQAYGFEPYALTTEQESRAHGNDERLSLQELGRGIDLLGELIEELDRR